MKRTAFALCLAALSPFTAACDAEIEAPEDIAQQERALSVALKPYHGRWEGAITPVNGVANEYYDATIVLSPRRCSRLTPGDVLSAEWDYYDFPAICTSDLTYLGVGMKADGTRVWSFSDVNNSGPCFDGTVSLRETSDPDVMEYSWRDLDGTLNAQGDVARGGLCTPGFGS